MRTHHAPNRRPSLSLIAALIGLLVVMYGVLPRLDIFRTSLAAVRHANVLSLFFVIVATAGTYLAAAIAYMLLAKGKLALGRTMLVQFASAFVNRLLPAGIGGIGLNVHYLKKQRHSYAQASAVVATNNALGFVGHGLLLFAVLVLSRDESLETIHWPTVPSWLWLILMIVPVAGVVVLRRRGRVISQIRLFLIGMTRSFAGYEKSPGRVLGALASLMILTLLYVLGLFLTAGAIGVHLPFASVFIIYTFGVAAGTATPMPGGLVGAEAGLTAGLIAYGIPSADALAIALTYRLITYWLPILGGIPAFALALRKQIL